MLTARHNFFWIIVAIARNYDIIFQSDVLYYDCGKILRHALTVVSIIIILYHGCNILTNQIAA